MNFDPKDYFGATNFLTKNAPILSAHFFEPLFCGFKEHAAKFPPNFPAQIFKNDFTDEPLQERREKSSFRLRGFQ